MKKNYFGYILILATIVFISLAGTSITDANIDTIYSDLKSGHWAEKFITKMNVQKVITGYTDNTFKPNNGINQLEAISMIVRFLGYQEEADSANSLEIDEENELYKYIQNVPEWARGNVLVAARLGLISIASEAGFEPTQEASRAWMTKLLVSTIQKHGTIPTTIQGLNFSDESSIPSWAKNEVKLASSSGIISGYPDGTFKPNRTVTRAEMTTLLYNSEIFIDFAYKKNIVEGKIEIKQEDALIINVGINELKRIHLSPDTIIYQGNNTIDFNQLKTSDEISAVINNESNILFLDLLDTSERKTNEFEGIIYLNDVNTKLLTIEDENKKLQSYKYTDETIFTKNKKEIPVTELRTYDKVKLLIEEGEIKAVEIIEAYEQQKEAEIISINLQEKVLTVKFADNTFEVITINNNVRLIDQLGGSINLESLKVSDKVRVGFERETITSIQLPVSYIEGYEVTRTQSRLIELSKDGIKQEYNYNPEMEVKIKGYLEASFRDVEVGDKIKAQLYQGIIMGIEVLNKERKFFILDDIDESAKALRVKDSRTNQLSYINYDKSVALYRNHSKLNSITQLGPDDRILLTIQEGKVIRIDKAVNLFYEIIHIDEVGKSIWLKDQNNKNHSFRYSELTNIQINNTASYISNLNIGDNVTVYMNGNEVIEIRK